MCWMVEGAFLFHFLGVFLLEMWIDNSKKSNSVLILWMCFHCCNVWVLPTEKEQKKKNLPYSAVIHFILISVSHYLLYPNFPPAPHPLRFSPLLSTLLFIPLSLFHQPIISQSKTISPPPDISLAINEMAEWSWKCQSRSFITPQHTSGFTHTHTHTHTRQSSPSNKQSILKGLFLEKEK